MRTARWKWFAAGFAVAALALAGLGVLVFLRAGATQERLDGHREKAAALFLEADTLKETDPGRYDEVTGEAGRYTGFAEADQQEYESQFTGALLLGSGAAACLAGCFVLYLSNVGRRSRSPEPAGGVGVGGVGDRFGRH
ncbi:hypothetical protein AB0395_07385 [Streptosporangium sp. NPDC051023]|uniref:hypothetical protein n=1 Tax=Streptosporangium sp. NPDC051023 TaxID=3155410 RepID=UPI00344DE2A5